MVILVISLVLTLVISLVVTLLVTLVVPLVVTLLVTLVVSATCCLVTVRGGPLVMFTTPRKSASSPMEFISERMASLWRNGADNKNRNRNSLDLIYRLDLFI